MKQREDRFAGVDGTSIFFQYWEPEGPPRAVLLLVHGAAEHCGRYQHVAEFFTAHGYAVAGLDHPGHGRSEGACGFIRSFDDYVETVQLFYQQLLRDFGALPQILVGHSLGGLISTCYLLKYPDRFAACVLSGPAIKTDLEPGFLQMTTVRLLSRLLPKFGALQLAADGVSRSPEMVQRYREDPLVYTGKLSARLLAEMLAAMNKVQENASSIQIPMLIMHGGADSMTSPEGSRFLHKHIASERREVKIYPGLYHEIFNEPEREQVFADMLCWLEDTLKRGS